MAARRYGRESSRRRYWLIAAGVAFLVAFSLLVPYQGYPESVTLVIQQGMSRYAIANELYDHGVLYSSWPFLFYAYTRDRKSVV